jgi:hypothetical protein
MTTLMKAHHQWATRPADERFTSLTSLHQHCTDQRERSRGTAVSSRKLQAQPVEYDNAALVLVGPDGQAAAPTNYAFEQLCGRVKAPAGYLRNLPSPMVADLINYGLFKRDAADIGVLLRDEPDGLPTLAAATGPNYGRIWNNDVTSHIMECVGDGVTGRFTVPGEFGQQVDITSDNTTLYASDRDMFVFLADEQNRIEIPNRRNGQPGTLARGFFVWNSEVGDKTLGVSTFLYDYVCSNRMVWGATKHEEIKLRHTVSAPDRFREEIMPAITAYANSSADGIVQGIENARKARLGDEDAMLEFLAKRFNMRRATAWNAVHKAEEGRPIETLWDATVAMTAAARSLQYQDARVDAEREAGKLMALAQ